MKTTVFGKRTLCLLTAALLLAGCLVSCGKDEPASETDTPDAGTASVPATHDPDEKPNITDKKFSGEAFNIAYMTGGSYEMGNEVDYSVEEADSSMVSEAVFERNRLTEERLSITINGTFFDPRISDFNTTVMSLVLGGDDTYDAICNYLRYNYDLVKQGALVNIRAIDSFCLDNPWWDRGINENFSFLGERQFFATGDICIDDDCTTEMLYFNKQLYEDLGLALPYDDVRRGAWTIDDMTANMALAASDLNGDGVMDKNDRWGLGISIGVIPAMMVYCGAPSSVIDEKGLPRFAYSYRPEQLISAYEAIFNAFIVNPNVAFTEREMGSDYAGVSRMFASNQLLYHGGAVGSLNNLRDTMKDDFGVIPYPKLNEKQDTYYTNGAWCASTYAIPLSSEDPERTGAILNVMGYYSVDTVTETVIRKVVMIRNLRDEISEEMLRLALANKTYDMGLCLGLGKYQNTLYNGILSKTMTFTSDMESIEEQFNHDIAELIKAFQVKQEPSQEG